MSQFLQDVEITNFKSIRHQKIEGCRRINVFIGYPNVGKSNILEALGLLSFLRAGERQLKDLVRAEALIDLFSDSNRDSPISLAINGQTELRCQLLDANRVKFAISQINGSQARDELKQWDADLQNAFSPTYTKQEHVPKHNESDGNNVSVRLTMPGEGRWPVVKPYRFQTAQDFLSPWQQSLDFPTGKNLFPVLEKNSTLREALKGLLSDFQLKTLFDQTAGGKLRILKLLSEEVFTTIPFSLLADTFQRLIFFKAAIATNENGVLLFEEPEAHMFPPYIRSLMWDIVSGKDNQFFLATHSPFVLDYLMEEAPDELSIYLVDYREGETKIQLLPEEHLLEIREYGVDLFFNTESYLKRGQEHSA